MWGGILSLPVPINWLREPKDIWSFSINFKVGLSTQLFYAANVVEAQIMVMEQMDKYVPDNLYWMRVSDDNVTRHYYWQLVDEEGKDWGFLKRVNDRIRDIESIVSKEIAENNLRQENKDYYGSRKKSGREMDYEPMPFGNADDRYRRYDPAGSRA